MLVFFCKYCGWQSEPTEAQIARECPGCRCPGLSFVSFDPDREGDLVQPMIDAIVDPQPIQ